MPALAWSIYLFGFRALTISVISVVSSVLFEYIYRKILRKSNTVSDLSAVVTGLLLAFCLPVSVPLWLPIIGSFFAIVIVKQLYGGIGKNILNPAIAARVFLSLAFTKEMTSFTVTNSSKLPAFAIDVSAEAQTIIAGATPLADLKNGILPEVNFGSVLIGNVPGTIGEVSATLLILTGIYLIIKKVITWHIPVSMLSTVAIITYIFPKGDITHLDSMSYQVLSGGLVLAAFFMATDYTTSPATKWGRVIYGVGCSLITVFIRYFGSCPEGVSVAILIMNLLVRYIDRITMPKPFGVEKQRMLKERNIKNC
jgi:electron transport complex protein RnfD